MAERPKGPLPPYMIRVDENREVIKKENPGREFTEFDNIYEELWRALREKSEKETKAAKQRVEYKKAKAAKLKDKYTKAKDKYKKAKAKVAKEKNQYTKAVKKFKANGGANAEGCFMPERPRIPLLPCTQIWRDENREKIKEENIGGDGELWQAMPNKSEREAKTAKQRSQYTKATTEFEDNGGVNAERSIMAERPSRPLSPCIKVWLDEHREKIMEENPGGEVTEIDKRGGELRRAMKDKSEGEAKQKNEYTKAATEFEDNCDVIAERSIMAERPSRPLSPCIKVWLDEHREKIMEENPGGEVTEIDKRGGELRRAMKDKSEREAKQKNKYTKAATEFEDNGDSNAERSIMVERPSRPLSPCIKVWLDEHREKIIEENPDGEVTEIDKRGGELRRAMKDKSEGEAKQKNEYTKAATEFEDNCDVNAVNSIVVAEKPKHPVPPFLLWLKENREKIKKEISSGKAREISVRGGELWRAMKDKSEWKAKSAKQKDEYRKAVKEFEANDGVNAGNKRKTKGLELPQRKLRRRSRHQ